MKTLHLGGWKFQSVKSFQSVTTGPKVGPVLGNSKGGSKGGSNGGEGLSAVGKLPRRGTLDEKLQLKTREKTNTVDGTQETAVMETLKRFKSTTPGLGVQGSPRFEGIKEEVSVGDMDPIKDVGSGGGHESKGNF